MIWNYRVIKNELEGDVFYTIHDVYYTPKGNIKTWGIGPESPAGESLVSLENDIKFMKEALSKPILEKWVDKKGELKLREVQVDKK